MATISNILSQGKKIKNFIPIRLPIVGSALIYGFVAINESSFSNIVNCPPLGSAHVIANRIIFSLDGNLYRFPIFSSISKPTDDKYPVYLLHVPRLIESCESYVNAYLYCMKNNKLHKWINKVDGVRVFDGIAYYYPREDEYLFETTSQLRGFGNSFVVITRRISSENGNVFYEVWNPNEIELE